MKKNGDKNWTLYVLRCGDGTLYTGIAKDVLLRLKKHQSGKGAAYTKTHQPVVLIYREDGFTRSEALIREAALKRLPKHRKELLIGTAPVELLVKLGLIRYSPRSSVKKHKKRLGGLMAKITFKGNPINTAGNLPTVGSKAPDFKLTKTDLSDISLKDFAGKKLVLNIFPSIDTPVCQASTRRFNSELSNLNNTVVVCVSRDLPFALNRFCGAEGLKNVVSASQLRDSSFGDGYGVKISEGPLAGLFSRAVVVVDEKGNVAYTEQVPEIAQEPNYEAALNSLKQTV